MELGKVVSTSCNSIDPIFTYMYMYNIYGCMVRKFLVSHHGYRSPVSKDTDKYSPAGLAEEYNYIHVIHLKYAEHFLARNIVNLTEKAYFSKYSSHSLVRPPYLPRNCGHINMIKEVAFGERKKKIH